jgi:hypothetical protein
MEPCATAGRAIGILRNRALRGDVFRMALSAIAC